MASATASSSLHSDAYFTVSALNLLSVVVTSKHASLQFDSFGDLFRLPVPFTQALFSLIASIEACYTSTYPEVEPSLVVSSPGTITMNFKSASAKSFVDFEKPIVLTSYLDDKSVNRYSDCARTLAVEMMPDLAEPAPLFPVDFTPAKVRGGDDYTDEEAHTLKTKLAARVMESIKRAGYARICVDASSFLKRMAHRDRVVDPVVRELRNNGWVVSVKAELTLNGDGETSYTTYMNVSKK
jgi:hypothetical protein